MARKLLKTGGKRKIVAKKAIKKTEDGSVVLVGTYREKQLDWIKKNGVYNYPVNGESDGRARTPSAPQDDDLVKLASKVKELWLYSGAKAKRHCFAAEFVGIQSKDEFLAVNPTYATKVGKPKHAQYAVFKTKPFDYGPKLEGRIVVARAIDFATGRGQTKKISAAIRQFHADGEFAPLAAYLPTDLAKVPRPQLRVCEAAVQLEFAFLPMQHFSIEEVSQKIGVSVKVVRRLVASGVLTSERNGSRYFISSEALDEYKAKTTAGTAGVVADIHFVVGRGIDPEQRDMLRRGKSVGAGRCAQIAGAGVKRRLFTKTDIVNWCDISAHWECPGRSRTMTFVDLFCGAGGLSKGLEMAGLGGVCGLDWFDEAGQTYSRNFNHPFINGDIKLPENKQMFYDTVRERLQGRHLSLVAGGFPCQGFSMAGNRIVDDPRNSLYKELIEIVETLSPDFVLCENVKGLRSMLGGAVEKKILNDFKAIGYDMNVTTLCAADYYVPQKRERVIFLGNRIGVVNVHPKPLLKPKDYITTAMAIGDLMEHPEDPGFNHVPTRHRQDMIDRMRNLPEGESLYSGYSDAWKKCPWDQASCTIKENHGGVNVHPRLPRVLTAREMARLQSFPDNFIFSGRKSKQLIQIGNAVPPLLGKAVGLAIRTANQDF